MGAQKILDDTDTCTRTRTHTVTRFDLNVLRSHTGDIASVIKRQGWGALQLSGGFLAKEQMPMKCNFCSFSQ